MKRWVHITTLNQAIRYLPVATKFRWIMADGSINNREREVCSFEYFEDLLIVDDGGGSNFQSLFLKDGLTCIAYCDLG